MKINSSVDLAKWDELIVNINFSLPESLRNIYVQESGGLMIKWFASSEIFGENCTSGFLHLLSPDEIASMHKKMLDMVQDGKSNATELESNEGLQALAADWEGWIPIFRFPNGDAFCIDTRNNGSIVFMEHDVMDGGPYIHGSILAPNIDELIYRWSEIGFVDFYDWSQCVGEHGIDLGTSDFHLIRKGIK